MAGLSGKRRGLVYFFINSRIKLWQLYSILLLSALISSADLNAQNLVFYGLQPNVSVSKVFSPKWESTVNGYSFMHPYGNKEYGVYYRPVDWQFYLQGGISYVLNPFIKLESGYVFQRTNSSGVEDDHQTESRPWEGVFSEIPLGKKISLLQRFRVEERFLYNRKEKTHAFSVRLRYRLGVKIKLNWKVGERKPYYLNTYNEVFFVPYGPTPAFYNENRLYFGLGYTINSVCRFEAGYFMQYLIRDVQQNFRMLNLLQLSWIMVFK